MDRHTGFYRAMAFVAIAITVAGFVPGLVLAIHPRRPMTPLVAAHATLSAAWLAFFLAQTWLVKAGRTDLHRRIGWWGGVIAAALVITGFFAALGLARRGTALSGDPSTARDPVGDLVFPLGDLVTFSVMVGAAWLWRRQRAVHARLMLFATLGGLMPAALAHFLAYFPSTHGIPLILPPLTALYVSHAVYDKITTGRIHPLSLWGAVGLFVWANSRAALIGPSAAWHGFVAWLIS